MSRICKNCEYYGHFETPFEGNTGHCMLSPPDNQVLALKGKEVLVTRPLTSAGATCSEWSQKPLEETEDD